MPPKKKKSGNTNEKECQTQNVVLHDELDVINSLKEGYEYI
jgi:hypothetical protein